MNNLQFITRSILSTSTGSSGILPLQLTEISYITPRDRDKSSITLTPGGEYVVDINFVFCLLVSGAFAESFLTVDESSGYNINKYYFENQRSSQQGDCVMHITSWDTRDRKTLLDVEYPIILDENNFLEIRNNLLRLNGISYNFTENILMTNKVILFTGQHVTAQGKTIIKHPTNNTITYYNFTPAKVKDSQTYTDHKDRSCPSGTVGFYDTITKKFYTAEADITALKEYTPST